MKEEVKIERKKIEKEVMMKENEGKEFYDVGGKWRKIEKMKMNERKYKMNVMNGYEMEEEEEKSLMKRVEKGNIDKMRGIEEV